jgi:hypothetical protein
MNLGQTGKQENQGMRGRPRHITDFSSLTIDFQVFLMLISSFLASKGRCSDRVNWTGFTKVTG